MNIKSVIYDTLEKENKVWIPKNHNPSSASFKYSDGRVIGKDLLTLYLKWTGLPPTNPMTAAAILRTKLGNGVHDVLAEILAKAGIKALSEVKGEMFVPELKNKISYRVDGLHELNGNLEVLEVKSVDENQLLGKGWGISDKGPKEEHLLQIIAYLNLVPGVKRARLLYIARDTGGMVEFVIDPAKNDSYLVNTKPLPELSWSGIISRWKDLETALENKTVPQPEFRVWLNDDGVVMPVKQIKGVRYKSDWNATYSPYLNYIYLDPKNYETATYNALFKAQGKI